MKQLSAWEEKISSGVLLDLLEKKFSRPQYMLWREVRDATGFDAVRSADAMALGIYGGSGRALWGFEVKVSRADWLRELKQPDKAESLMRFCDHWAVVVSDPAIIGEGELPPMWGQFALVKNKLKVITPAPKLAPQPLDRITLAALLYAEASCHSTVANAALDKAREEGIKGEQEAHKYERERFEKLQKEVAEFKEASGVQLSGWTEGKKIGEAVRAILKGEGDIQRHVGELKHMKTRAENIANEIGKQLQSLITSEEPAVINEVQF